MRLALVIHALPPGGAERVLSVLANHWDRCGHQVQLLTLAGPHAPAFSLRPGVDLRHLGLASPSESLVEALGKNLGRLLSLRRALKAAAPDVVIPFMTETNVLTLLAVQGLGLPVIATEHTVPGLWPIGRKWELLRRLTYRLAARVVVPTRAGVEHMRRSVPGSYAAIPNPVALPSDNSPADQSAHAFRPLLLGVGRLAPEKGFDLLMRAFSRVAPAHPAWRLSLLGEGPQRSELECLAASLGLAGRVLMPGNVADPFAWMRGADLFAMTSHFEGFSNALAEALACGLPAVAVDCPFGPAEIITHGRDGLLVPPGDAEALSRALDRLMEDAALRAEMARRAPETLARFGIEAVGRVWDAELASVLRP